MDWTPLHPFGHGLSYTRVAPDALHLDAARVPAKGRVTVSVTVKNVGDRPGDEVVQLYLRDPVASVTRPLRELKGFTRLTLAAGEQRRLSFVLGPEHFGFHDREARWTVEPGRMTVQVGTTSAQGLTADFEVVASRDSVARPLRWPMARARLRP